MDKNRKSKVILGQSGEKLVVRKSPRYFNRSEKEYIIQEYLLGECTKREIWEKYTGRKEEHGSLLRWMRSLGLTPASKLERTNFIPSDTLELKKNDQMQKDKLTHKQGSTREEPKVVELQSRIEELEKELELVKMRAIAYSTMIDVAEREFNIPIRKK